jgi:glycosyltransferase involved in cell wall biosynthesis
LTHQFKIISHFDDKCQFNTLVGMAVYIEDRLDWVQQAAMSILDQTYRDYLLVIVIDGEVKPDVLTFLVDLGRKTPQVVLIDGLYNRGLSTCMNFIIDWSLQFQPQYFFRMDADDISEPQRLSRQVEYLDAHPEVSVLGTALIEVNEAGSPVGQRKLPLSHDDIIRFLPKRCSINHPTVAIRYNVFNAGHRYRNNLRNTQDYFLWAELATAGFLFENLSEKLLKFRRVNDFYKRRGLSKSINEFKARLFTMKVLRRYSIGNIIYALAVLALRLMPSKIVKCAYTIDRHILERLVKH